MKTVEHATRLAAQLCESRGRDLLRFLRRRSRSSEDARDIAQEAYLRFIRLAKPDSIDNPEAYLFRIASNLLWERQLAGRQADAAAVLEELTVERTPFDLTVCDQAATRVRQTLADLPPTPRAVLVLHLRDGLTYAQIAAQIGVSVSMIKKHMTAALAHCRLQLRGDEL